MDYEPTPGASSPVKTILLIAAPFCLLGGLLVAALIRPGPAGRPAAAVGRAPAARNPGPPAKAPIAVFAEGIWQHFQINARDAEKTFLGKAVWVQGVVYSRGEGPGGPYLLLGPLAGNGGGVKCDFPRAAAESLRGLQTYSRVNVQGTCTGFLTHVALGDCVVMP